MKNILHHDIAKQEHSHCTSNVTKVQK